MQLRFKMQIKVSKAKILKFINMKKEQQDQTLISLEEILEKAVNV